MLKEEKKWWRADCLQGKNMAEIWLSDWNWRVLSRAKIHVIKFAKGID